MGDDFNYEFGEAPAEFKSKRQIARVWSEGWLIREMYCPACGNPKLNEFANNQPAADAYCEFCEEQFELKASKKKFGKKIRDGAYSTMLQRIQSDKAPSLLLMEYNEQARKMTNLSVVPQILLTPKIIQKCPPLKATAKRAGHVMCNILIGDVPKIGRIELVKNRIAIPKTTVLDRWAQTQFLRGQNLTKKGWILDVLNCVENLDKTEFSLNEVYKFENYLGELHPENHHVKPKIRQQLQVLRDAGILEFLGQGRYRVR